MQNRISHYWNNIKKLGFQHCIALFVLAILSVAVLGVASVKQDEKSFAAIGRTTFWLCESGVTCGDFSTATGNALLDLMIDGSDEDIDGDGDGGLLGAEVHIAYPTNLVQINSVTFTGGCRFDNCMDLSENGTIKLLGASGPSDEGGRVITDEQVFARFDVTFLDDGSPVFGFTTSQVIDENEQVDDRFARSLTVTVGSGGAPQQPVNYCGDGSVGGTEECDDGNADNTDSCLNTCERAQCGDGFLEVGSFEQCDDGNVFSGDGCSSLCQREIVIPGGGPSCGDGVKDAGEECDDGDLIETDSCLSNCTWASCGDGYIYAVKEQCDDSNPFPGDGCSDLCQIEAPRTLTGIDLKLAPGWPEPVVYAGESLEILVIAGYSDKTFEDITHDPGTEYVTGNHFIAWVAGGSIVGGRQSGQVNIRANYEDQVDRLTITNLGYRIEIDIDEPFEQCKPSPDGLTITCDYEDDDGGGRTPTQEPEEPEGPGPLHPSSPENETDIAENVVNTTSGGGYVAQPVELPENVTIIDNCKANYSNTKDSDGDGLSDRTECYLNVDVDDVDSDGDSCWDGDELNQFYTHPLESDCNIQVQVEEKVLITDPHPGWIIQKLDVAGIAPETSESVGVVVFAAEHRLLKEVTELIELLNEELNDSEKTLEHITELKEENLSVLEAFLESNEDYAYDDMTEVVVGFREAVEAVTRTRFSEPLFVESLDAFNELKQDSVHLGNTSDLSDIAVGDQMAKNFQLNSNEVLINNKLYDMVAIAHLPEGETLSSAPVRFSMDSDLNVQKPIPRSIGGEDIPQEVALKNSLIPHVLAQVDGNTIEIAIEDSRPIVAGDSEFGSQVFAIWNSIVLASSVIADSEQGSFAIQAPRNLSKNESHRVTLYALKTDDEGRKLRSESVDVFFAITPTFLITTSNFSISLLVLALALALYMFIRRLRKRNEAAWGIAGGGSMPGSPDVPPVPMAGGAELTAEDVLEELADEAKGAKIEEMSASEGIEEAVEEAVEKEKELVGVE